MLGLVSATRMRTAKQLFDMYTFSHLFKDIYLPVPKNLDITSPWQSQLKKPSEVAQSLNVFYT